MSGVSTSRHHADWLSLVEVSGPFVSLPVLLRVFPQGLEPRDPAQARALREVYEEWQDNPAAPGRQRAWVLHVLTAVLGYPANQIVEGQALPAGLEANMPEMGETLRPDYALVGPAGSETAGQAHLLITTYSSEQALDRPVAGKHWKAAPATRMMELLHASGVPLGLVTNGEHWMLVYAPRGETTGYASWYASLWLDEPITLRAFHSLLGARRFFGVAADSTSLAMLAESASDQQEVTDQLGYQVREAVEVLVQSFDALDKESNRALLKGVAETALYDAALTVMMRLVFLFSAEERGLLHLGKPLYDDNYAVSTLQEQLQAAADQHGEEVLERRYDAWARLLAAFRAVFGGIPHQDLLLPAYGGSLFDPDRYPFLEGRAAGSAWRTTAAEPLAVNNRVVLHLLNSLQRLRIKTGGAAETRRVSFRALGVEQIGTVYEGLLDHTALRAGEPVIGIRGTRSKEPEVPLSELEALLAQGPDALIDFLKDQTGRSAPALRKALEERGPLDEHKLLIACGQDEKLLKRLHAFAGHIRDDSFERPLVVLPGSVYVTAGTTRRSTGTHYTPPSLTQPIVQRTLEPQVYEGPAEGWPREQWKLKPPKDLLALKVCDMAMGSGAFLVQACRYLAERLVEAWETAETQHPGEVLITPEGGFSQGMPSERLVPADAEERLAIARRIVADRCLYGVDKNPMAVEMAKLSLWLVTLAKDRPFTFLDHAFKCGDSLVGADEDMFLRWAHGYKDAAATLFDDELRKDLAAARAKRRELESFDVRDERDAERKAALLAEADAALARIKLGCDLLIGAHLLGLKPKEHEKLQSTLLFEYMANTEMKSRDAQRALAAARAVRAFHWLFEFPEVFEQGGFSAFVGNPPYQGGTKISSALGKSYLNTLMSLYPSTGDRSDLVAYFIRRMHACSCQSGIVGIVTTDVVAKGDTQAASLAYVVKQGSSIMRASQSFAWPGAAGVRVVLVWVFKGTWQGVVFLGDDVVDRIGPALNATTDISTARRLIRSPFVCGMGAKPNGTGFILEKAEALRLLEANPAVSKYVKPFVVGADLNDSYPSSEERWAIHFGDMSLDEAEKFPECMAIVRERVWPERSIDSDKRRRLFWWQFERHGKQVYAALDKQELAYCFARSTVSRAHIVVRIRVGPIYSSNVVLFCTDNWTHFAVLQSQIHTSWFEHRSATMPSGNRMYVPSECLETFPWIPEQPEASRQVNLAGERFSMTRETLWQQTGIGPNKLQHLFDNPTETSADIVELRRLYVDLDNNVAAAYGWQDLELGHGFHETAQGVRYTLSEPARREVLARLLKLNHERWEAEQKAEAEKPKEEKKPKGKKKAEVKGQGKLL